MNLGTQSQLEGLPIWSSIFCSAISSYLPFEAELASSTRAVCGRFLATDALHAAVRGGVDVRSEVVVAISCVKKRLG